METVTHDHDDTDRHILIFSHFSVYVVHDIDCHRSAYSNF